MSDFKKVQLFKLSRELGVSTDTLVGHLQKHGHAGALEGAGVNAKVSNEEAYFALLQEFSKDKDQVAKLREMKVQAVHQAEADRVRREAEDATRREAEERERREADERVRIEAEERAREEAEARARHEAEAAARRAAEQDAARIAAERAAQPVATAPATTPADAPAERPSAEAPAAPAPVGEALEGGLAPADGEAVGEDGVITADRYKLTGTTVIGKIDLSQIGMRSGKRPRKAATEAPTPQAREQLREAFSSSTPAPAAQQPNAAPVSAGTRKDKKGKKGARQPVVNEAEVAQNVNATRQQLEQGGGRKRQQLRRSRRDDRAEARLRADEDEAAEALILRVTEFITTGELANLMDVSVNEVIGTLFSSGMMVSINQRLDADTIQIVADEFGFTVEFIKEFEEGEIIEETADDPADLLPRAPVVTVMGHVDHGKTSLLDFIRTANVVSGEAGGITQHIGAYSVPIGDRAITFLDTPGHEAFTAMRARGAQATDIVILVVAADDAVMPQTIEAINHAKAASVPIVVAINKIDKAGADPPRVMQQLADQGVLVEQYGGQAQCALVSAKKGEGIQELLDKVLIEADLLELKANPDRNASGLVIESRLDRGRGVVATVLVQNGTLKVGDAFVAGIHSGRVRAMFDERDARTDEAGPGKPVGVLGFSGAPEVGDRFVVMDDEREAREIALRRGQIYREQSLRQRKHITLAEIGRRLALGEFRELNLIIKADVGGSVEALSDSLQKLSTPEVAVAIIHSGVGAINESDVMLASASDAVILGFQVRPTAPARAVAEREEIDIRTYSIIYDAISDVRDALEGLLSPEQSEKTLGTIEVRETFKVPKIGTIAGCFVTDGKVKRPDRIRLVRDGIVVFERGSISSLKRFKDDVREVSSGYECGLGIDNHNDVRVGDVIEAYEVVETKRKLVTA